MSKHRHLAFDIETDGLYEEVTKVHVIRAIDRDTGQRLRFTDYETYHDGTLVRADGSIQDGIAVLEAADCVYSANGIKYDEPVLDKLHGFKPKRHFDARVASALIWTDLRDVDHGLIRAGKLPREFQEKGLMGRNSVRAWGFRLGNPKADFDPKDYGYTWATVPFLQDMDDYCDQDVDTLISWLDKIDSKNYSEEALELEMAVAQIIARQERNGFAFDVRRAEKTLAELQKQKLELEAQLQGIFPPWRVKDGKPFVPKRDNSRYGYKAGVPVQKYKTVIFNPGSRDQIADRLMTLRGWRPTKFTPGGKPQVDEETLSTLDAPEAKQIVEYLLVDKRRGQVEGYLKAVGKDGRIHGTVNSNGAVTGRMTHASPNVANADKHESVRALFVAPAGRVLVGCDAEGLELRALGHYMAPYDGGKYADAVVNGRKEDGTDAHTLNQKAIGLNTRDNAKTFIYALIYGAGDFKLGTVVYDDMTDEQKAAFNAAKGNRDRKLATLGKNRRARLMKNLPALAALTNKVKEVAKRRGALRGIDGRLLKVRGQHAALNTLLQSAGAIVMKKALVILDAQLTESTLFVANVHDEWQMETDTELANEVGRTAADAIRLAGEHFKLNCPLSGSFDVGANWSETH